MYARDILDVKETAVLSKFTPLGTSFNSTAEAVKHRKPDYEYNTSSDFHFVSF